MARKEDAGIEFVGRESELKLIGTSYSASDPKRNSTVILSGPPGVGKTALASRYVMSRRSEGVFWINASSLSSIYQSILSSGLKGVNEWQSRYENDLGTFYSTLPDQTRPLLVFDNACAIESELPPPDTGVDILLCARSPGTGSAGPDVTHIQLQNFSEEVAMELFWKTSGINDLSVVDACEMNAARQLIDGNYLPLHVSYIGNQIRVRERSIGCYYREVTRDVRRHFPKRGSELDLWLKHYRISSLKSCLRKKNILSVGDMRNIDEETITDLRKDFSIPEKTAFEAVLQILQEKEPIAYSWEVGIPILKHSYPVAYKMLLACSLLETSIIPRYLLRSCLDPEDSEDDFETALSHLVRVALLSKNKSGAFSMHPFIQESIFRRRLCAGKFADTTRMVCKAIVQCLPNPAESCFYERLTDLLPHIASVAKFDVDINEFRNLFCIDDSAGRLKIAESFEVPLSGLSFAVFSSRSAFTGPSGEITSGTDNTAPFPSSPGSSSILPVSFSTVAISTAIVSGKEEPLGVKSFANYESTDSATLDTPGVPSPGVDSEEARRRRTPPLMDIAAARDFDNGSELAAHRQTQADKIEKFASQVRENYGRLAAHWGMDKTSIDAIEERHSPLNNTPSEREIANAEKAKEIVQKWVQIEGGVEVVNVRKMYEALYKICKQKPPMSLSILGSVDYFTGRDSELLEMNKFFFSPVSDETFRRQSCKVLLLHGVGGIGKTELTVRFAYSNRAMYTGGIFHLNGESPWTLRQSVLDCLSLLMPDRPDASIRSLSDLPQEDLIACFEKELRNRSNCLLLFDPADKLEYVESIPLQILEISAIVCSRSSGSHSPLKSRLSIKCLEVEKFSAALAIKFFEEQSSVGKEWTERERQAAKEIVGEEIVDGHPLGLFYASSQVKNYKSKGKSVEDYLKVVKLFKESVRISMHLPVQSWIDNFRLSGIKHKLEEMLLKKGVSPLTLHSLKALPDESVSSIVKDLKEDKFGIEAERFSWGINALKEKCPTMYVWEVDIEDISQKSTCELVYRVLLYVSLTGASLIPEYLLIDCLAKEPTPTSGISEPNDVLSELLRYGLIRKELPPASDTDQRYFSMHSLIKRTIRVRRFNNPSEYQLVLKNLSDCMIKRLPSAKDLIQRRDLSSRNLADLQAHVITVTEAVESFLGKDFDDIVELAIVLAIVLRKPSAPVMCKVGIKRAKWTYRPVKQLTWLLELAAWYLVEESDVELEECLQEASELIAELEQSKNLSHFLAVYYDVLCLMTTTNILRSSHEVEREVAVCLRSFFSFILDFGAIIFVSNKEIAKVVREFLVDLKSTFETHLAAIAPNLLPGFYHSYSERRSIEKSMFVRGEHLLAVQNINMEEAETSFVLVSAVPFKILALWEKLLKVSISLGSKWKKTKYMRWWIKFLFLKGHLHEAKQLCHEALKLERDYLPDDHEIIGFTLLQLAQCHLDLDELHEAVEAGQSSLRTLSASCQVPSTLKAVHRCLGEALLKSKPAEAENQFKKVVKISWNQYKEAKLRNDEYKYIRCFFNLYSAVLQMCKSLLKQRNFDGALKQLRRFHDQIGSQIAELKLHLNAGMPPWTFDYMKVRFEEIAVEARALTSLRHFDLASRKIADFNEAPRIDQIDSKIKHETADFLNSAFVQKFVAETDLCELLYCLEAQRGKNFSKIWSKAFKACFKCSRAFLKKSSFNLSDSLSLIAELTEICIRKENDALLDGVCPLYKEAIECLSCNQSQPEERHCQALEDLSVFFLINLRDKSSAEDYGSLAKSIRCKIVEYKRSEIRHHIPVDRLLNEEKEDETQNESRAMPIAEMTIVPPPIDELVDLIEGAERQKQKDRSNGQF